MSSHDFKQKSLASHKKLGGKIGVSTKASLNTKTALNMYYTPGVGAVAAHLAQHPEEASNYTLKRNSVAIISDGSAVLGLGNIGPLGALPVMEGKAMIFKEFADIDAWPIVLNTQDPEEIIATIKHIAPGFGGINLEDIAAPQCFIIEEHLKHELDIPVMHDDQHGTAIVVLAGLINACRVTGKKLDEMRIALLGAGAAGTGIAKLITYYSKARIIAVDSKGIIYRQRPDLSPDKHLLADISNSENIEGDLRAALKGADVVIGVSKGDLLTKSDIQIMADQPIVFAMANPEPEILPTEAKAGGALVVATGRSDFANQINNALVFPGIFRGALDTGVYNLTDQHKVAAAEALAGLVTNPSPENIIPSILDKRVVPAIAHVIR